MGGWDPGVRGQDRHHVQARDPRVQLKNSHQDLLVRFEAGSEITWTQQARDAFLTSTSKAL